MWTALVCVTVALTLAAVLYDLLTRRIPSRLRSEDAPSSDYGLVRVDKLDLPGGAYGIDIILVHGLGSNPDTTWGPKDNNWVSRFLLEDIPPAARNHTRFYFYNYNTYYKRDAIQARLRIYGEHLLSQINTKIRGTEKERTRSLLLVGHSYGGLVIKQALVHAKHSERFANISEHAKAVFFLGTPHRGSYFSAWGSVLVQLLQPLGSNPLLLKEVVYDALPLSDLHRDFENATSKTLQVVNFYETRKTQILKLWFFQWKEFCVPEQSARLGQAEDIPLYVDHYGLNKFERKDENYRQFLGKLLEVISPIALQKQQRFSSVPIATVESYTERDRLSTDVIEKLGRDRQNANVPRCLAITGLGGAGKTQLALKYVEDRGAEYDTILWIDAREVESARSSFERCASELRLPVDRGAAQSVKLVDSPTVQAVLRWLRNRKEADGRWLVVVDNADDLSWGIKDVIPRGILGSVIITSQDRHASRLVRDCEEIQVGHLEPGEARSLLLKHLKLEIGVAPEDVSQKCDEIAKRLEYLVLAIDLAGAYVANDEDPQQALRQYLTDYEKHRDDMLQSAQFRGLSPSDKTVWTVWDTTFEKLEQNHAQLHPTALLAFLSRFKGSIVQDEMFRLASLGMAGVDHEFGDEKQRLPSDFRRFLTLDGTLDEMDWESYHYRQSRNLLVRYSLVQRVKGEWPGVTMHSLVKWRAMHYKKSERWEWWNSIFILAACYKLPQEFESLPFRRHLLVHVPETVQVWLNRDNVGAKTRLFMQRVFNRIHHIRQEELYRIHEALGNSKGRGTAVLCGISGVGKTQLATIFAECHSVDYSAIFWVDATSEDSANMSYASFAKNIMQERTSAYRFDMTFEESKKDEFMSAVKRWLNHTWNTRWLIICDNFDGPAAEDVHRFLPDANHGSVIIITRSSTVEIGCRIQVRDLDILDSLEILSKASSRKTALNDPDAAELAKRLGGHSLALATAGAYISQADISFADYLRLFEASWSRLPQTRLGVESYMESATMSTLQLSLDRIRQESEPSAQLLQLWAYFDNQDLWLELLQEGSPGGPDWLCQITDGEPSFRRAIRVLLIHGLVEVNKPGGDTIESEGYRLHSAVHMWTVDVLDEKCKVEMAGLALECVASHIPDWDDYDSWALGRRLLRHAARCWSFVQDGMLDIEERASALESLGCLFAQHGKYGDAEKMYQRALRGYEKVLGREHPSTLSAVNNLGLLYAGVGRLDEAEMMYQRALLGYEKVLGPEHTSTLSAVNNLGVLYAGVGRLNEAEMMCQRALRGCEKAFGREHTSTLSAVHNLGILYADIGRLDEAELMYQRALRFYEKELGPEHTSTLSAVNNLGNLYADIGRLDEAEMMCMRALRGHEKVLGPGHTSTLSAVRNLGNLYANVGRFHEAESMYLRAIRGYEKALGSDHATTLNCRRNLGSMYMRQDRYKEAEELVMQVRERTLRVLGEEHPSTLKSKSTLALLYHLHGRFLEAEKLTLEVMETQKQTLGEAHPSTLTSKSNLATTYYKQGRLMEAEKLEFEVMEKRKQILGPAHPSALTSMANLASIFREQGRLEEAEELDNKVTETRKQAHVYHEPHDHL